MSPRWGALLLVGLVLTGCAATPQPTQSAAPSDTATAEPAAESPLDVLQFECGDLFTDAEASALASSPVTLRKSQDDVLSIVDIATIQAGLVSCDWGGDVKTRDAVLNSGIDVWDQGFTVEILPDGADAYAAFQPALAGAAPYVEGAASGEYLCTDTSGTATSSLCRANVLVGDYQVRVDMSFAGNGGPDVADPAVRSVLATVTEAVASSVSATEWTAPADALQGTICAGATSYPSRPDFARVGWTDCPVSDEWTVSVVPGGSWALPLTASAPELRWDILSTAPITIAGADWATWGCGTEGVPPHCYALVSGGGSAVGIAGPVLDESAFAAGAADVLSALVAAE